MKLHTEDTLIALHRVGVSCSFFSEPKNRVLSMASKSTKDELVSEAHKLADIISDYWSEPTAETVLQWVDQLDSEPVPIVSELAHILSKSYLSAKRVEKNLRGLISTAKLVGSDPPSFWKNANLFNDQKGGQSQRELLDLFDSLLRDEVGFGIEDCGSDDGPIVYIDDFLLSGNRLVNDLRDWIADAAPKKCTLHTVFMGTHSGGSYYAGRTIAKLADEADKTIKLKRWSFISFENYSNIGAAADVYRLRKIPKDERSQEYLKEHVNGTPKVMRPDNEDNKSKFFSSEQRRNLLEQTFWATGLYIREIAPNLKETHRPLGYTSTNSDNKLGFGSIAVSYRNCPNNCPLAYWAGDPWFSLLPRKTN